MGFNQKDITYRMADDRLTNTMLAEEFGVKEDYIFRKTRIKTRYTLPFSKTPSDLAEEAINDFFKHHDFPKNDVDFLIFCSEGFDYIAGLTSAILQHKCGFGKHTRVMDLPQGCTGYIYGLMLAKSLIVSGMAKNVLFVTSDLSTKTLHPKSLELRSIFSDAATVTLIRSEDALRIGEFVTGTDGSGAHHLYIERSSARNPIDKEWVEKYQDDKCGMPWGNMIMDGMEIFLFAIREVPSLVNATLEKNNLTPDDIDLYIFHQANGFLLETLRKKLKIDPEKFFVYLEEVGNTVSGTLPICLVEADKQGLLKPGMNVMLVGFGIGLCWGATIIKA